MILHIVRLVFVRDYTRPNPNFELNRPVFLFYLYCRVIRTFSSLTKNEGDGSLPVANFKNEGLAGPNTVG